MGYFDDFANSSGDLELAVGQDRPDDPVGVVGVKVVVAETSD